VNYLLELSRLSYRLVPVKPSLLAAAAVYLARATLGIRETARFKAADSQGFWTKTLQYYTGYAVEDMKDTVRVLLAEHRDAEMSSLKSAFNKYSKAKCMHVSTKTVLDHEYLNLDVFSSTSEN
jgi:Cyclin, C-terminal domain